MPAKTLIYDHDKDTKNYAKFVPARGERATGAIYLDLDDAAALGGGKTPARLHVEVTVFAAVPA